MDRDRDARRQLIRKANLFALGFLLAAVVVALVGAALVAWLLGLAGFPFLPTWLAVAFFVLVIPAVGATVRSWRDRRED